MTAEDVSKKRRRVYVYWGLAIILLGGGSAYAYRKSQEPIQAQKSFDAGQKLFVTARYSQAILSFDRTIALMPEHAQAYMQRGRAHAAVYDEGKAIEDFTRAIELLPRDTEPLLERGNAYLLHKSYAKAIADASAALALNPRLAAAYTLRGIAVRDGGDPAKALDDFTQAVNNAPDAQTYFQRGATYQLLDQHRLAIADFTETIQNNPDAPQGYFARAESERALGQDAAAKQDHLAGRARDLR